MQIYINNKIIIKLILSLNKNHIKCNVYKVLVFIYFLLILIIQKKIKLFFIYSNILIIIIMRIQ